MFEFGSVRFRPVEKEDLKLLHGWENDFELMVYSRGRPLNFASLVQLEKLYDDWVKDEKELHFVIEFVDSKEAIGVARLRREDWGNVKNADIGTYIGKRELWGKGLGKQITAALLEMAFLQLNVERCDAWSVEYNRRAHEVLGACGFKRGGAARQSHFVHGRKWDDCHFDILREEYLKGREDLLKHILGEKVDEYLARISVNEH
jgi:diamine N-acetyltransferase